MDQLQFSLIKCVLMMSDIRENLAFWYPKRLSRAWRNES